MVCNKIVSVALLFTLLAGCGGSSSAVPIAARPQAVRESIPDAELTILASMSEDVVKLLAEAFEADTDCAVSFAVMPPDDVLDYLMGKQPMQEVDIYLGGSSDVHESLKSEDLLLYRESSGVADYSWRYYDRDHCWEPVSLEMMSIGVNTESFGETFPGVAPPTTLEELADTRYKGKLILAKTENSYAGLTLPLSIFSSHGREAGERLLRRIGKNVGEYAITDLAAAQKVATGNYPITLGTFSAQYRMKEQGFPIQCTVYPEAGWTIVPVSILHNTQNPRAAEAFLTFVLSKEGQRLIRELNGTISVMEEMTTAEQRGHRLRDYPVNNTFWSYRETTAREHAAELMASIQGESPESSADNG